MKVSIAHICINTDNLSKTEDFYCRVLGLIKVFDFTKNGKKVGCYLKVSEKSYLEIFETNSSQKTYEQSCPIAHFCLETDDIDEAKKRLNDCGISSSEKKLGCDNTYQIWFKDPNGINIEFHQYTDSSTQLTGENVEIDW